MSRQFWIIVAGLLVATAIYSPFSPAARQSKNMKLARQHATLLQPQLAADPRFAHINLVVSTGSGGALHVYGEVETQTALDAADALIKRTNPPCPIVFSVRVMPATAPATQPQE